MVDQQRPRPSASPPPPDLQPPGSLPETSAPESGSRLFIGLGLTMLMGLAVAVVIVLPRYLSQHAPEPVAVPSPPHGSAASEPSTESASGARLGAEASLREFLRLRARLELENAPAWGDPEWGEAAADVKKGDRLFLQNDFVDADDAYRRAIDRLKLLESSRPRRLAEALRQGTQALASNRVADAAKHFEYALAIDAENPHATDGLARTRVREQVLALMLAGEQAEAQGELEAARAAYQGAADLDAEYQQAAAALQRVAEQIENTAFRASMDEAIQAFDKRRYTASDQALKAAAALRPDDDSVRDLRRRLDTARKQGALAEWRRRAQSRALSEDWQSALDAYVQALKVDPAAAFAVSGAEQARARLRLHRQIDRYLKDPSRLASDQPLANAERVLQAAGDAPAAEPLLARKLVALRQAVAQARTPVTIELRSDGETDVVIYHVGHRGRFLQQQLELRPGTYTVVGSRAGYRDVRRQFVVQPGAAPLVVTIRCEEPI